MGDNFIKDEPLSAAVRRWEHLQSLYGWYGLAQESHAGLNRLVQPQLVHADDQTAATLPLLLFLQVRQIEIDYYGWHTECHHPAIAGTAFGDQSKTLIMKESRRYCNFLKDDLGESTLGSMRLDLATTINKFDKAFKIARKNNEDRS